MSQRTERIDELLRAEISALLIREVADPRIGFATVTRVETASDLHHARVWVSIIGQPEERELTLAALRRAMPFIRHELGGRIRLRRIPDLHVQLDDTTERGTRVLQILADLAAGEEPDPQAPVRETLPTPLPRLHREGDNPEPPDSAVTGLKTPARPRKRGPGGQVRSATGRDAGAGGRPASKPGARSGEKPGRRGRGDERA